MMIYSDSYNAVVVVIIIITVAVTAFKSCDFSLMFY